MTLEQLALLSPTIACFVFAHIYWRAYRRPESDSVTRWLARSIEEDRGLASPVRPRVQMLVIAIMCAALGMGGVIFIIRDELVR
jgi:hypothetical protein